jgi:hypothetical protein
MGLVYNPTLRGGAVAVGMGLAAFHFTREEKCCSSSQAI